MCNCLLNSQNADKINTPLIVFSHVDYNCITFPKWFYTHTHTCMRAHIYIYVHVHTQAIYMLWFFYVSFFHSELYLRSDVPVVDNTISSLEFYRDWVATNLPVLIKGAVNNWPAVKKWNLPFLRYIMAWSSSSMYRFD
jgi:hypothetical protein